MSKIAEPADINVDELRRRARRRLVGAVVLALGVAVVVPMLLDTEQKPLGDDVAVKIPPVDDGKFVNRLNDPRSAAAKAEDAAPSTPEPGPATSGAPARTSRYDTRVPDASSPSSATPGAASADSPSSAQASPAVPPAPETSDAHSSNPPASSDKRAAVASDKPVIITDKGMPARERPAASASEPSVTSAGERASTASAHRDGFAVQLAAFADDKGANSLAGRLKRAGYAAYTEPLKTSKGTLWRVRVGPYPSREAALAARDKLKTTEGQNGIVAAIR